LGKATGQKNFSGQSPFGINGKELADKQEKEASM